MEEDNSGIGDQFFLSFCSHFLLWLSMGMGVLVYRLKKILDCRSPSGC